MPDGAHTFVRQVDRGDSNKKSVSLFFKMLQKVVAQVRMFAKDELHQMPETRIKEMQLGLETWHSI